MKKENFHFFSRRFCSQEEGKVCLLVFIRDGFSWTEVWQRHRSLVVGRVQLVVHRHPFTCSIIVVVIIPPGRRKFGRIRVSQPASESHFLSPRNIQVRGVWKRPIVFGHTTQCQNKASPNCWKGCRREKISWLLPSSAFLCMPWFNFCYSFSPWPCVSSERFDFSMCIAWGVVCRVWTFVCWRLLTFV